MALSSVVLDPIRKTGIFNAPAPTIRPYYEVPLDKYTKDNVILDSVIKNPSILALASNNGSWDPDKFFGHVTLGADIGTRLTGRERQEFTLFEFSGLTGNGSTRRDPDTGRLYHVDSLEQKAEKIGTAIGVGVGKTAMTTATSLPTIASNPGRMKEILTGGINGAVGDVMEAIGLPRGRFGIAG